ncbi:uncharacterized protein BX664DRAFT_319864 [Halteromyces radiatus]|uniref:uncharacterized protein n=1 Tax=Halteromyces radiatus TaxID=101107 RepID=UPI0022212800|nr:uncharacterized protein BX664DRAFT_319864 [Halteromyces radiatus]KAI8098889.1 hypothetical protein BX664DRAFT_319864 [Halteromyces radiatus]
MTSVHPDSITSERLPLTMDNLKKKTLDSGISSTDDVLERYCQDILLQSSSTTPKRRKQRSTLSSEHSRRQSGSIKSSTSRDNTVMASPRLLPFPYHNDSLFLPTVEQHRQLERAKSVASTSSMSFTANRRQSNNNSTIHSTLSSSSSSPPLPRRQSSAPPTISKRRKVVHQSDLPSSQVPTQTLPKKKHLSSPKPFTKAWFERIWKLMKKSSQRHRSSVPSPPSVMVMVMP